MHQFIEEYPFRCSPSLSLLIDYWTKSLVPKSRHWANQFSEIRERLDQAPELCGPVIDFKAIDSHKDLVTQLMSPVFPPALWDGEAIGALVPFTLEPVFVSGEFRRLLLNEDGSFRGRLNLTPEEFYHARLIRAYLLILGKYYDIEPAVHYPLIRVIDDPVTGLERHFRIDVRFDFVDVGNVNGMRELTKQELATVKENLTNPRVLREILPPEDYDFRGFTVVRAVEVTESEVLSQLGRDLVDQESIFSSSGAHRIERRLRCLFHRPDLHTGLAALQGDHVLLISSSCDRDCECIFMASDHVPVEAFKGSLFATVAADKEIMVIPDLRDLTSLTPVEQEMIDRGYRSLLVAPLTYQGQLVGQLYLKSPRPGDLGQTDILALKRIVPLFSMALKRAVDEFENRIDSIIKERCTAVHPSVEWRFQRAVFEHLERFRGGEASDLEPIVFRDVFPLYAASDIRGSSEARSRSIQDDLSEHLNLALDVLRCAREAKPLPVLHELTYRVSGQLERIRHTLSTGDDKSVISFLRNDVEPVFTVLAGFGAPVKEAIDRYNAAIDPKVHTVYRKRKDFEESVSRFNERITGYLDREESEAQSIFPHYFDKHQTDGVDYLIYVGASMAENGGFDELYVRNLRLWQIMVACGIAWHTEQLKRDLKVSLDSAHLVLVNHSPLSIRFRFDEKRFDVDGAYDVGHEIIRSRIDKATVKGHGERLTQPGKIAIVYSRAEEEREMRRHIDFLRHEGFLKGSLESLDLDDLPGVQGLRALRVTIDLDSPTLARRVERLEAITPQPVTP